MVERITGIPKDQFLKAADLFTSIRKNGDMKKAATIIYAVGWTQHTFGTQIIRTAAMLQLLMGNVGTRRRRRQRASRPFEHSGRHGHGRHLRQSAGLPEGAESGGYRSCRIREADHADIVEAGPWDSFNYWSNTPKFVDFVA